MNIKKIGKVLLVLFLVAIYANIGYWLGTEQYLSDHSTSSTSIVQSFFQGPEKILYSPIIGVTISKTMLVFTFFWPTLIAFVVLLWLGHFMFVGGLFKTIGLIPSIVLTIAGILYARKIWVKKHQKTG
ncbi:hypothetical protein KKF60_00380 [Patescibacteria group bacterium]|nr:hypothetical protein [Patescibacteria group bacterium]MBU4458354.1 hypothetical protein [Patescibacteria group bacterium]MCG2695891.1 hypothetical protein [Candidatus Portnoybacteria bacterium]